MDLSQKPIAKELPLKAKDKAAVAILSFVFVALLLGLTVLKEELIDKHEPSHYLPKVYLYLIVAGIFVCSFIILAAYMLLNYREGIKNKRLFAVTGIAILLNYIFCLAAGYLSFYAMPLCFAAITVSGLVDRKLAFTVNLVCVMQILAYALLAVGFGGGVEAAFGIAGGNTLFAVFVIAVCSVVFNIVSMGKINSNTGRAGLIGYLALFSALVLPPAFLLALLHGADVADFGISALCIAAGAAAQIFLTLFFTPLFERVFMITTNGRLAELCDLRQPLLKRLMNEAPATFSHSQTVGNLAESCASALGLNVYMARASALYHDIGKLQNVEYYTENQSGGKNPHDDILPELSAEIIHQHTADGYRMAIEARLPKELAAMTMEHHGTTVLKYFYEKAKRMTDSDVDDSLYRYKCNKPSSKIAAVLMICDSSEAAIRAMASPDKQKVEQLVDGIIQDRIAEGQFDNCEITIKDLAIIRQTIADMSMGFYHTRIGYPKG